MTKGRYGIHGGQYMPETLMNAVLELEAAYDKYKDDPEFKAELAQLYREYANRPSLLYYAERMTKDLGGAKIYLKREDLNHTGAHKINNVLGQILLAKKMGKKRVIAETGAGQHGVATATAAALMGMECVVYMGKEDWEELLTFFDENFFFNFTYYSPVAGSKIIRKCYVGDRTYQPYDIDSNGNPIAYKECKLNVIDTGEGI